MFKFLDKSRSPSALFLGSPEAEAETHINSKMKLLNVYEDYHNLYSQLSSQKFILIGRKGSGKSAFAEYVYLKCKEQPIHFCSFIRPQNISLEELVQCGNKHSHKITDEHLFKWLIYVNLIKLFFENQWMASHTEFSQLNEFVKKNSGYVDISNNVILEKISKNGFNINTSGLSKFFRINKLKETTLKEGSAQFYQFLPHLEQAIKHILNVAAEESNDSNYIIFFDDLDIHFKSKNTESVNNLIKLLRTVKQINKMFSENGYSIKIIILMRDDVVSLLRPTEADMAKLFSSYSVAIDWYQDEYLKKEDENKIALKKLIEKRCKVAFEAGRYEYNETDIWGSLVSSQGFDQDKKTTFKYIVDYTFFRPRDLMLFFAPLENGNFSIPLSKNDINHLVGQFSTKLKDELSNELFSFYSQDQVHNIYQALSEIYALSNHQLKQACSYDKALKIICNTVKEIDTDKKAHDVLNDLLQRSIIGTMDQNNFIRFKNKSSGKDFEDNPIGPNYNIIVHLGLTAYLAKKY